MSRPIFACSSFCSYRSLPSNQATMANIGAMLDDPIVIDDDEENEDENQIQILNARVALPPCAKPSVSYGHGRGGALRCFVDNDARNKMLEFGRVVGVEAARAGFRLIERTTPVVVHIWAFLRRPDTDFVGRRREAHNLTETAMLFAATVVAIKPDNDNLAKFLLDSLTGVLCADDAQVVDLRILKARDNEGLCEGRVQVHCRECTEAHYDSMMPNF